MSKSWTAGSTRAWRRLRRFVLERDGYACQLPDASGQPCGAYASHVDHVVPRSAGGLDVVTNLRASCPFHNLSRGAGRTPARPAPPVRWTW